MALPPGVFVREERGVRVERLPTAVTAFVGPLPALAGQGPVRVVSYPDFLDRVGAPPAQPMAMQVTRRLDADGKVLAVAVNWHGPVPEVPTVVLHGAVAGHFQNGGTAAWIVPTAGGSADELVAGLQTAEAVEEVTLLAVPDAVHLDSADWVRVAGAALASCARAGNRMLILDVPGARPEGFVSWAATGAAIRAGLSGVPGRALRHGAAYAPFLRTGRVHEIDPAAIRIAEAQDEVVAGDGSVAAQPAPGLAGRMLSDIGAEPGGAALQRAAWELALQARVMVPPSGVVSGLIARVDREQGVWKAPANVAPAGGLDPALPVSAVDEDLLRDEVGGMAINPFRSFAGRGVLLWGARTLAGRDLEIKYVPQRRLMLWVGACLARALAPMVFEPNTPATWAAVRGMVEAFLTELWREGAMQGTTAREAFFVAVGLGVTMTDADVAAGRMVVEVGLATVRPAEFVILRLDQATAGP